MRRKVKTIKLAKVRRHIRECIRWYNMDKGMPHFYTSENYQKARRIKEPSIGQHPYYARSDRAIKEIAEKIYDIIKEEEKNE